MLCQNVPIARTGHQVYLASELPLPYDDPNKKVTVYRREEDVFAPSAIASFEGKPTTNEHPDGPVTPDNVRQYLKGVVTNVRRGTGNESDMLLADLVIYDAHLISEVENGKREVSCGYDCEPTIEGNRIYQKFIEGNHVAIVSAGRAGSKIAIKDESPLIKGGTPPKPERSLRMAKRKKPSERGLVPALARFMTLFKDSEPDEVVEAVEELVEVIEEEIREGSAEVIKADEGAIADEKKADAAPTADDKMYGLLEKIYEKVEAQEEIIEALKEAVYKKDGGDPLAKLEAELEEVLSEDGDPDDESEFAEDPEDINEEVFEDEAADAESSPDEGDAPVMPEKGKPKNILTADAALKEIRRMKPIIAGIKDVKQRKLMTDSLARMARAAMGVPANHSRGKGYSGIVDAQKRHAANRATRDSKKKQTAQDIEALGDKIAAARLRK